VHKDQRSHALLNDERPDGPLVLVLFSAIDCIVGLHDVDNYEPLPVQAWPLITSL